MIDEVWKPFRDTRYDVSNKGRVRSTSRPDASGHVRKKRVGIMTQKINKRGYATIALAGKWVMVHRMVGEVFVENSKHVDIPISKLVIDHIDNNKTNNNFENLQWLTYQENTIKAHKDGLVPPKSPDFIEKARNKFLKINESHKKPVNIYDKRNKVPYEFDSAKDASLYFKYACGYFSDLISKNGGSNKYWSATYTEKEDVTNE